MSDRVVPEDAINDYIKSARRTYQAAFLELDMIRQKHGDDSRMGLLLFCTILVWLGPEGRERNEALLDTIKTAMQWVSHTEEEPPEDEEGEEGED